MRCSWAFGESADIRENYLKLGDLRPILPGNSILATMASGSQVFLMVGCGGGRFGDDALKRVAATVTARNRLDCGGLGKEAEQFRGHHFGIT